MADLKGRNGATGNFETVAKWSVGEGKQESKTGTFSGPADAENLVAYLQGIEPGKEDAYPTYDAKTGSMGPLNRWFAYECLMYGLDLKVKAKLRPTAAVDSPWIVRDEVRINLATGERIRKDGAKAPALALDKRIAFINMGIGQATLLGNDAPAALLVAKRMLVESKEAREANGALVIVK